MIRALLFDLDGTLCPLDMELFTKYYFSSLIEKMKEYDYEPNKLLKVFYTGLDAMFHNEGSKTNEEAFWDTFFQYYPEKDRSVYDEFMDFYLHEFNEIQKYVERYEGIEEILREWKKKYRLILATNPLFPSVATEERIAWAGLSPDLFEEISTYENYHYCKPNLKYYEEVFQKFDLKAEECLMIGNDTDEDMIASQLGCQVFLLTDHLLNRSHQDLDRYPHGKLQDLQNYIAQL